MAGGIAVTRLEDVLITSCLSGFGPMQRPTLSITIHFDAERTYVVIQL